MKAVHLRVERPCVTRRVSACLRPKTKRGETSSVRWPRNTYWASRTSSERAGTREASRSWQRNHQGRSAGKQSIPCLKSNQIITGRTTWTKAYNILVRFTLKKAWTFLKMESPATKVWFGQSKRATLFEGTCFKILLLIFACFLETASQDCVGRWHSGAKDLEDRSCQAETSSTKYQVPFENSGCSVPQSEVMAVAMLCSGQRQLIIILGNIGT